MRIFLLLLRKESYKESLIIQEKFQIPISNLLMIMLSDFRGLHVGSTTILQMGYYGLYMSRLFSLDYMIMFLGIVHY